MTPRLRRSYVFVAFYITLYLKYVTNVVECSILIVGSANADTFLPVERLPTEGENLTLRPGQQPIVDVPGGKGCTQAVAAAKLSSDRVLFMGQFGNDAAANVLRQALTEAQVDLSHCGTHDDLSSGRGYVFWTRSGQVSAVVSGGANQEGWGSWQGAWEVYRHDADARVLDGLLESLLDHCKCVLLQREVPEYVNRLVSLYASRRGILVMQDVGGEDRALDTEMMGCCDYIVPNESELRRLIEHLGEESLIINDGGDEAGIVSMARLLQKHGARNVLVTLGPRGSLLLRESGDVLFQSAFEVSDVVDETGAGDCFRAAFAVALMEGQPLHKCLEFASAAGACSVAAGGAVPSTPTREQVDDRCRSRDIAEDAVLNIPRGDGLDPPRGGATQLDDFPFLIGSRLNSMKDRPDLWCDDLKSPSQYVQRQKFVNGLTCVDFNYPQHFCSWTPEEARAALDTEGLVAGAVCLRYPSKFARGAMNHPDAILRRDAIELTKQAAEAALVLGCKEVVVWSAYDGYDYPFQVNYDQKWQELVDAFRECCDAFPHIKFSLEYKPTDENTRFFTVASTGAALLMVEEVDRPNFGLTLDVGHMLMAGENPGQSIAMVGRLGKLFGIQLNDGYTRLAAEDGLMFGSVHPAMALEIMYQLRRTHFSGHFYFDTFPQRSDPVKEAEYNIKRAKSFWRAAGRIDSKRLRRVCEDHDAVGALELVDDALGHCER